MSTLISKKKTNRILQIISDETVKYRRLFDGNHQDIVDGLSDRIFKAVQSSLNAGIPTKAKTSEATK